MVQYQAPIRDMKFILHDVLNIGSLAELPGYEDFSQDLADTVIDEAAKFCEAELFPINQSGDEEGCVLENGVVRTPTGFREAFQKYIDAGWNAIATNPAYGGQGLPKALYGVIEELQISTNLSFSMYSGLTQGAYSAVETYGSDEIKNTYLPKLSTGEWTGTMCLTEPQCGTDLGLIQTKAIPQEDGTFKLTGTKIFISAGEHDLVDNIIHLVLARLPDAPAGTKGLTLFLVPKFLVNKDGSIGARNQVYCGSIEHKMGIKASSTAVLNFDDAEAYMVGEPNKGMPAMFVMMNGARLAVAIQGLGVAETSYQTARTYAMERLQGRSLKGPQEPDKPADPIIVHPDIRRQLLNMKSFTEAARGLLYWAGINLDVSLKHPDPQKRQEADDFISLMIPILKAYCTDTGFEMTNLGVQILGGHGYIREWGMEQLVRDARIPMIYEGTNYIQALDLVGRKMPMGKGRLLRQFFHPVSQFLAEHKDNEVIKDLIEPLAKAFTKLQQATLTMAQRGLSNPEEPAAVASDYLHMFALVAMGYMWTRMALVAQDKMSQEKSQDPFYTSKLKTARFFMQKMLPRTGTYFITIMTGAQPMMDLSVEEF